MKKKKDLPDIQRNMPELIKRRREKLGLTQQQVADIASISTRQYQRFETGERQISGTAFRIGVAIADILEMEVHELVHNPTVDEYLNEKKEFERLSSGDTSERGENNND